MNLTFDVDDPALAWAAWSRLVEPGDAIAGALVAQLGPSQALRWLLERGQPGLVTSELADTALGALHRAAAGWTPRLSELDPVRDLAIIGRLGGAAVFPDDARWPVALHDLGAAAPMMLWVRGDVDALAKASVALVGSRASTPYGETVARELAEGLIENGYSVISGGAYGIDAAAHRGALAAANGVEAGPTTIAIMAGGLDRYYPPGNANLLRAIAKAGAVGSEAAPGVAPFRHRFLARNRLIAALSRATVVVEAAWRSGALSTANHAASLLRPVGAVPGPVTSMASGGCHRLIRDGLAVCVTDAAEVVELAAPIGEVAIEPKAQPTDPLAGLGRDQRAVCDALPLRATATPDSLTRNAGQPLAVVLSALGVLEARGLAQQSATGKWRRAGLPIG